MFADWDYVKPENEYVDEDELQHTRATFIKESLGDDYTVECVDGEWLVTRYFGNECGVLISDGVIDDGKVFAVTMRLFHNDDPVDVTMQVEDIRPNKIQETVDWFYEKSKVMMEKTIKEREEANKKPEISHINLDANESVTFTNWDGSNVTVSKVPTDYGICRYMVTIEGHAEVITDLGGDAPEVNAEHRAERNDDINNGKKSEIRYAKSGPARTMVTFGESERLHDYGGGLYGGEVAIYKDLITREYIVSVVGNVEVINKEKEEKKDEE